MKRINYKSDFDFILHLKDCKDPEKAVPFPDCGFDVRFWASNKANAYTASYKDGVYTNCFRTDDGGMHFVFDNHRLGVGTLKWEPHFEHPNDIYPGNIQDLFSKEQLDIELVDGPGDCPTSAEVEIIAPFIKGDKGDKLTYSDLTDADKADLIAPIKDDIDKAMEEKADRTELSNVIGDITSFEDDVQFEAVTGFTRADLKLDLFIDLFNAAAGSNGRYDPEHAPDKEHVFLLNGLWLTYAEAVDVYLDGTFDSLASAGKRFPHRTNLPIRADHSHLTIDKSFTSDNFVMNVEVANLSTLNASSYFSAYPISIYHKPFGYAKLKKIIGVIDFHFASAKINWFVGAVNLEEVNIHRLAYSIDLSSCGKLNLQSFSTMITHADSDADSKIHPRMITVHAEIYSKLTDPAFAEWSGLIADAAAKNITFITA